ncbi:HNH endonuclease [Actinokineospora globicatena]|uniref:HNH endonuclease n=1 Tax=Actinokineospora globicatena TaxID=103729 RepID=UPI0020A4267B|nr:HNH endonuclease [Actinokineospora globicatena]MCP2303591.1 putative restriction endonuclease [Actinokineospora globicatena]GLW79272.1 hypothetical protein Aglo01_37540 [Actinokineospora globicatena]GLW86318.1 hypothetical protein Aglo02_39570 [Actinokineospora globicatena]
MGYSDVRRQDVLNAIARCDNMGRTAFLAHYGFHPAREYVLVHGSGEYDSKAIVGVAHEFLDGKVLASDQFSGGRATVGRHLESLGFLVRSKEPHAAPEGDGGRRTPEQRERSRAKFTGQLRKLNRHHLGGRASRHQPLSLLWAIGRLAAGAPRMHAWVDFRREVGALLRAFGGEHAATPEYPFWHLHKTGFWEVDGVEATPGYKPRATRFDELRPSAGFTEETFQLLRADTALRTRAVNILLAEYLDDIVDRSPLLVAVGLADQETAAGSVSDNGTSEPAGRRSTTRSVIIRNSVLVREVKALHDDRCQLCGDRLRTAVGYYSEAAHIRGLGAPHHGPDELSNLLCLCPRCHILFDTFTIYIDEEETVRFIWDGHVLGTLRRNTNHSLDESHIEYHRAACAISVGDTLH